MSVSLERLAWNQVLFREVSERVAEIDESWDGGRPAFLCGCGGIDCETTIQLGLSEYESFARPPICSRSLRAMRRPRSSG